MATALTCRSAGRSSTSNPLLSRFFSLGEGSGGVQTTQINQAINLDVQLDRAIGFYATAAFNVDLQPEPAQLRPPSRNGLGAVEVRAMACR